MASDKSADEVAAPFDSQHDLGLSCPPVRVYVSISGIMSRCAQAASYWHFDVEVLVERRGDFHVRSRGWVTQIRMAYITKTRCQSSYRGDLCMSVSYKEVNPLLCSVLSSPTYIATQETPYQSHNQFYSQVPDLCPRDPYLLTNSLPDQLQTLHHEVLFLSRPRDPDCGSDGSTPRINRCRRLQWGQCRR